MESNEQQNAGGGDIDKRMEAARILREDAKAIETALIQDLTAQRDAFKKQMQEISVKLQDAEFKLACLRGELDEPIEDFVSKRHHVSDEAILSFLDLNPACTTSEIQNYFKFSSATVCRRLNTLLEEDKVTMEKRGTSKVWTALYR